MRIFVLGIFNSRIGGANGECLGAVQLWRRNGLEVTLIPTWTHAETSACEIAAELGCQIVHSHPRRLEEIPGLAGSTVVNFCNENAYACKTVLRKLGCRMIAVPCMCYPASGFRTAIKSGHVQSVVFQSEYQRGKLESRLCSWGYRPEMAHLIRGYIDWPNIEYQPLPHAEDEPFVVGRISRDAQNKWHKQHWAMYDRIPNRKAIVLGYGRAAQNHCGKVPDWATTHFPGAVTPQSVYAQLHAYVTCNGHIDENWPRVGLEAMSCGVPIVAENNFGWREMVEHGVSGMLGGSWQEIGDMAAELARDEPKRLDMAAAGRERLKTICDPEQIWTGWKEVLGA